MAERAHYVCLNCQQKMRFDDSVMKHRKTQDVTNYAELTEDCGDHGQARDLIQIICDAKVPNEAPICKQCSDALLQGMGQRLDSLQKECNEYQRFLTELRAEHDPVDKEALRKKCLQMQAEEKELREQLANLELENAKVEKEFAVAKAEKEKTKAEAESLWAQFRDYHKEILESDAELRRYDTELRHAKQLLDRLVKRGPMDLAFSISADADSIGTINGFRLGRLPHVRVDDNEISNAWGQAALLLDILLKRMEVRPTTYEIVCLGRYSYIKELKASGECRELPLYLQPSKWRPFAGSAQMDDGAAAFLDCLALLASALLQHQKKLPFAIRRDQIFEGHSSYSIKMEFHSLERWTRALRLMLIDLNAASIFINAMSSNARASESTSSS